MQLKYYTLMSTCLPHIYVVLCIYHINILGSIHSIASLVIILRIGQFTYQCVFP